MTSKTTRAATKDGASRAEVEGFEGSFSEAVNAGFIEMPVDPMGWTAWRQLRSGLGCRPAQGCSLKSEAALWRTFNEDFFGANWKDGLRAPALASASASAAPRAEAGREVEAGPGAEEEEEDADADGGEDLLGWGGGEQYPLQPEGLASEPLARQEEEQEKWLQQEEEPRSQAQHFELDAGSIAGSQTTHFSEGSWAGLSDEELWRRSKLEPDPSAPNFDAREFEATYIRCMALLTAPSMSAVTSRNWRQFASRRS